MLDPARRRQIILTDARNLAFAQGLELVEDEAVLDEAAGLVEWPVVLIGSFDEAFLEVPAEAIQATIRANQKCFVTRDRRRPARRPLRADREHRGQGRRRRPSSPAMSASSAPGSPMPASSGRPTASRCRASRAAASRSTSGSPSSGTLGVVFHEKIGTQGERIERIRDLAGYFGTSRRRRSGPGAPRRRACQGRPA